MKSLENALVWFRNDLRLVDNPALLSASQYATAHGGRVLAMLVASPLEWRDLYFWGLPKSDYYWRSALALKAELAKRGIETIIHKPASKTTVRYYENLASELVDICNSKKCTAIYMNAEYESVATKRDSVVAKVLDAAGILHHTTHDQCVVTVGKVLTKAGTPYKVFTQFKRSWAGYIEEHGLDMINSEPTQEEAVPIADDPKLSSSSKDNCPELSLESIREYFSAQDYFDLDLEAVRESFPAGEGAARKRLAEFLKTSVADYQQGRNHFTSSGASRMSAFLAVGSISLKECLLTARRANQGKLLTGDPGLVTWINELCWRDFYRHVLFNFPHIGEGASLRPEYENLAWKAWPEPENDKDKDKDEENFVAWSTGQTGFPIVDAAMRQLRKEGWQCNRLRMVVAMFLTKDLLIHWRRGERFFSRHLVDYDFASNNGGWQWSASTGTDAQPYFRIFNPLLQSEKFDKDGQFIRLHVKELSNVKAPTIHEPFKRIKKEEFSKLGYQKPIVDHVEAKEKVFALFNKPSTSKKRPAE